MQNAQHQAKAIKSSSIWESDMLWMDLIVEIGIGHRLSSLSKLLGGAPTNQMNLSNSLNWYWTHNRTLSVSMTLEKIVRPILSVTKVNNSLNSPFTSIPIVFYLTPTDFGRNMLIFSNSAVLIVFSNYWK